MKIVYKDNEGVKVITPANWLQRPENMTDEDYNQMVLQVTADKDVPTGVMYKFVQDSEFPKDRTYRSAWSYEINESNKDGIGLTQEQFDVKYPDMKGREVK